MRDRRMRRLRRGMELRRRELGRGRNLTSRFKHRRGRVEHRPPQPQVSLPLSAWSCWRMHLYNAWLPLPLATAARGEAAAFAGAVRTAADAWLPGDPDSAYATLKWISVFDL